MQSDFGLGAESKLRKGEKGCVQTWLDEETPGQWSGCLSLSPRTHADAASPFLGDMIKCHLPR